LSLRFFGETEPALSEVEEAGIFIHTMVNHPAFAKNAKGWGTLSRKNGSEDSPDPFGKLDQAHKADVAQLVEQPIRNRQVSGSTPLVGSSIYGTQLRTVRSESQKRASLLSLFPAQWLCRLRL
jgi:hypothetical protein